MGYRRNSKTASAITAVVSIVLYIFDLATDIWLTVEYFKDGHTTWGALTTVCICFPIPVFLILAVYMAFAEDGEKKTSDVLRILFFPFLLITNLFGVLLHICRQCRVTTGKSGDDKTCNQQDQKSTETYDTKTCEAIDRNTTETDEDKACETGENKAADADYNKTCEADYNKASEADYNKTCEADYNKASEADYNKTCEANCNKANKADDNNTTEVVDRKLIDTDKSETCKADDRKITDTDYNKAREADGRKTCEAGENKASDADYNKTFETVDRKTTEADDCETCETDYNNSIETDDIETHETYDKYYRLAIMTQVLDALCQSFPQLVMQIYILLVDESIRSSTDIGTSRYASMVGSMLMLSWSLTCYEKMKFYMINEENIVAFEQKPRNCSLKQAAVTRLLLKSRDMPIGGHISLFVLKFCECLLRVLTFGLLASILQPLRPLFIILIIVGIIVAHFALLTLAECLHDCHNFNLKNVGHLLYGAIHRVMSYRTLYGQPNSTFRIVYYYIIVLVESMILVVLWLQFKPDRLDWLSSYAWIIMFPMDLLICALCIYMYYCKRFHNHAFNGSGKLHKEYCRFVEDRD